MGATLGEQLKQARLERNVTLAQVAETTRVKAHYLEALEAGDLASLPSRVQGKGYLRLYADYLGLPQQPLLDLWDGKVTPVEAPTDQVPELPQAPVAPEPPSKPRSILSKPISKPIPPPSSAVAAPSQAQAIFDEIGQQLAERRQALGLSLDEVEHHIKVRAANLQALEEGRISDLPSTVQARGMLSNYAAFLDLNSDAVLLTFAEALQVGRQERMPVQPQPRGKGSRRIAQPQKGIRRFLTPDLIIGGSVIVMLFFFAIWTASRINSERRAQQESTAPSIAEAMLGTSQPTAAGTQIPTQASIPGDLTGGNASNASEPTITPTLPVIGNGPVQIYVIGHQRAWVQILADNKEIFNDRLVPGNAYIFAAKNVIQLNTGNAAGVQVIFNDNDMGILGVPGQIKSFIFSSAGIVTPTPRFSPSPSPQPTATQTPQPTPTSPTPTITPFVP